LKEPDDEGEKLIRIDSICYATVPLLKYKVLTAKRDLENDPHEL
jgi:hypothetical protein